MSREIPEDVDIRPAKEEDVDDLARFNRQMAEETEDKVLDPQTVKAGVQALLNDASRGFYLVALRNGEIVGSVMITTEWSDWRNGQFWWIQSVYVRPDHRRQGIYTALHHRVRRTAREEEKVCGLRLYVERGNEPARTTYEKLGMTETSYRMYEQSL